MKTKEIKALENILAKKYMNVSETCTTFYIKKPISAHTIQLNKNQIKYIFGAHFTNEKQKNVLSNLYIMIFKQNSLNNSIVEFMSIKEWLFVKTQIEILEQNLHTQKIHSIFNSFFKLHLLIKQLSAKKNV